MKKITILLLAFVMLLGLTACGESAGQAEQKPAELSGCYLRAKGGEDMIVDSSNTVIVLNNQTGDEAAFSDLHDGDAITVTIGSIEETYPCRANCFSCVKTADGTIANISESVKVSLTAFGWLDEEEPAESEQEEAAEALSVTEITEQEANTLMAQGIASFVNEADSFRNYALVTVNTAVEKLTVWKLSTEISEDGTITITETEAIGTVDSLPSGGQCIAAADFGETVPFLGLSLQRENGEQERYYFAISGKDGSALLIPYEAE